MTLGIGYHQSSKISITLEVYEGSSSSDLSLTNSGTETLETDIEDNEYICYFYTNQEFYLCVIDGEEEYSNLGSISGTDAKLAYVEENENFHLIVSATGSEYVLYSGSLTWWLDPIHYTVILDKNISDEQFITIEN